VSPADADHSLSAARLAPGGLTVIGAVVLGRYQAAGPLGKGSMGQVYLARRLDRPGDPVVLKVMHAHIAAQPRFRELFAREVQSMARLRHPYIAELIDATPDTPAGPCLVMEHVSGITLAQLLRAERRLSLERVHRLLDLLCHALHAAHSVGIVHRDLKPANIMIVEAGTPRESLKVLDFGLADLRDKPYIPLDRLTGRGDGAAVGTPAYVCPEQLRGDPTDHRGDIYGVGVLLFEMLTGRLPFDRPTVDEILRGHVEDPPPKFAAVGAAGVATSSVESVVRLCLEKFPNERPQSARELATVFAAASRLPLTPPPRVQAAPLLESKFVPPSAGPGAVRGEFEAWMPESIAVLKLRGFVQDRDGEVTASEPGLVRVRFREPKAAPEPPKGQGQLLSWLSKLGGGGAAKPPTGPPPDPAELELHMSKSSGHGGPTKLHLTAIFRPAAGRPLANVAEWRAFCEGVVRDLKAYLIAAG
jgi:serine/threonine protein kinase